MKKIFSIKCILFVLLMIFVSLFLFGCDNHTHEIETIPAIQPTCTEAGYTEGQKCSTCTEIIVQPEKVDALGHTETKIPAVDYSCTTDGSTEGTKCSVCQVVLLAPEVVSAKHTEKIIPRVEPIVAKSGYTEGVECTACKMLLVAPREISLLTMEVDEKSSLPGKISCEISFNKLEGEFSLYYANKNKEQLSYYTKLSSFTVSEDLTTLELSEVVIPKECEYIIATNEGEYVYFVKIPNKYKLSEKEYTFGALSDVHYNRGDYFEGAVDFFDTYGVDFVGISGDLSDSGEISSYNKFNAAIKDRLYKVYTTTGNHDVQAVKNGVWKENINTGITEDPEVSCIGDNGIDFVFTPKDSPNNVFVFLCQIEWLYSKTPSNDQYTILSASQIDWLTDVLESNKDKNVFLFFHTFLSAPDGTQETAVGNLRNPGGYAYDLPYSYGSADEIAFRALMKKYKNVVYFSGHSHWMYEMEIYNENLNVSNFDGEYCYMVHVSSVCEPRIIEENAKSRKSMTGKASEGWIVEVYDEAIVLIPVDFMSEVFYTEYMEIIPLN